MTQIDQNIEGDGHQVVGQVNGDLINHHYAATPKKERPRNEKILLKTVRREVTDRLEQSLHNSVLINLPKESQPNQVNRSWDVEVEALDRQNELLPASATVVDIFDREDIGGQLLILGKPGIGKTTTLLSLAKILLARADKSAHATIPVLFNVSSWTKDKQIFDWLVGQLKAKYGVIEGQGEQWLSSQKILPLLDGFNELAFHRKEPCLKAINVWLNQDKYIGDLVICSRLKEYEYFGTNLALSGAICLKPLDKEHISDYLLAIGRSNLDIAISQDIYLQKIARSPKNLNMLAGIFSTFFLAEWKQKGTIKEREELLVNTYSLKLKKNAESSAHEKSAREGEDLAAKKKWTFLVLLALLWIFIIGVIFWLIFQILNLLAFLFASMLEAAIQSIFQ